MKIPNEIQQLIAEGALAHLVTLNPDGSPQVTVIWVSVDSDEIVAAHLDNHRKLKNIRRDPRVAISIQSPTKNQVGINEYAVLYGEARVEEDGAPALGRQLAEIYMGPDSGFPADDAPPGYITRTKVNRIAGVGPWVSEVPQAIRHLESGQA